MRKTGAWREALVKDLNAMKNIYGSFPMTAGELLDTELILTMMKDVFPGQDPALAWAVLGGYPLPPLDLLTRSAARALLLTRLHLFKLVSRTMWGDYLEQYRVLSSPYPLYRIDGTTIVGREEAVLPERLDAMREALRTPPPWRAREARYASAGRYLFTLKRERHEVELPPRVERLSARPVPRVSQRSPEQAPITVSLEALREEAEWMDAHAPRGSVADQSWGARIHALQDNLRLVTPAGLQPSSTLTLDGLLHLIGMVGSGKSSLLTVLTVYLARRGYRVTLVQGDVASLLREHAVFDLLSRADPGALQAVPLVGRSTRITHLNRLQRSEALRDGVSLRKEHPAYALLSTVCPLDGLRQDVRPVRPGEEPCTRLHMPEEDDSQGAESSLDDVAWDCPFLPVCPTHLSTRSLASAQIWLATPASLLASGPQASLSGEYLRNIDLVMRYAHVVLVDETDLVQVQFDDRFAPMEVLVRERGESWLDRVAVQVARQVYRPGRPMVGKDSELDRWLISHDNTQRAVNRFYIKLRENSAIRGWLGDAYFSRERLISRVAWELKDLVPSLPTFVDHARHFLYSPLVYQMVQRNTERPDEQHGLPPLPWYTAVHYELLESDTPKALVELERWLQETLASPTPIDRRKIERYALHLLVMLLVCVLDHSLQRMVMQWPAAEALDLDRGAGGLFYHPTEDHVRLVPEPPMGAVIGFQYYDPKNNGNGELRFFQVRGMGRALLYHLHDSLQRSDGMAGPHVVLTSGTSWAPGSWKYHLHAFPQAVLLPQGSDASCGSLAGQEPTRCFYDPLPDPDAPGKYLRVSGFDDPERRLRSLRAMMLALTRPRGFDPSYFDSELALLREDRQRILLIVGSYYEAEVVGETLAELLVQQRQPPYGEEVLALIPDSEGEGDDTWQPPPGKLPRSLLNHLPKRPARFLVAPLQAIERGHNILVGQEAAIGSIYFLVRPYPVPGDIHAAINKVNAWAMDYVQTLTQPEATLAGKQLREDAAREWDKALGGGKKYKELGDGSVDNESDERTPLLWTQFVLVWQCIGRLLRGGVSARVHFVDARWAENSPNGLNDTEQTSMLLGFRRILRAALADHDPARRAIAEALYGEAARAFEKIEGVYHV
jgi:pPIWI RE three-gene island domain Z